MSELRGKGLRVIGYLVWMLGAGVVLDSDAHRAGVLCLAAGAALFAVGVVQSAGVPQRSVS